MIKNEYEKELTTKSNKNVIELSSPSLFTKKIRKDGKGNIISKKQSPNKKTKYHAYLIDNLIPGQNLANIIDVESYKKYNVDSEEESEEEPKSQPKEKLEDNNVVKVHGCCFIF